MDEFVDKYYRMNPETEIVIPSGYDLKEGMRVLVEAVDCRQYISDNLRDEPSLYTAALLNNRWCVVTDGIAKWPNGDVSFLGLYDDGIIMQRIVIPIYAWIVKKDSIPVENLVEEESIKRHDPSWAIQNLKYIADKLKDTSSEPKEVEYWCQSRTTEEGTDNVFRCTKPASHIEHPSNPHVDNDGHVWEMSKDVSGCNVSVPHLFIKGVMHYCIKGANHEGKGDLNHQGHGGMTWR